MPVQNLKLSPISASPDLPPNPRGGHSLFISLDWEQISREDTVLADKVKIKALGSNVGSHWPLASE